MAEDLSRKALLVLVLVSVVVSVLSTTLVMNSVYHYTPPSYEGEMASPSGIVSLTVPSTPVQGGKVALTVINPNQEENN